MAWYYLSGIEGIEAEDLESLFEQFEGGMVVFY